jgi:hypothetical protein
MASRIGRTSREKSNLPLFPPATFSSKKIEKYVNRLNMIHHSHLPATTAVNSQLAFVYIHPLLASEGEPKP